MERKVAQTELNPEEYSMLAETARKRGLTITTDRELAKIREIRVVLLEP